MFDEHPEFLKAIDDMKKNALIKKIQSGYDQEDPSNIDHSSIEIVSPSLV